MPPPFQASTSKDGKIFIYPTIIAKAITKLNVLLMILFFIKPLPHKIINKKSDAPKDASLITPEYIMNKCS